MGVYIEDKDVGNNLKNDFNIKHNELFAEDAIKTRLASYYANVSMKAIFMSMKAIFMSTENSKTNKQHKYFLNLSQRLDLKS